MTITPAHITEQTPNAFREFCSAAAIVMAEQVFDKASDEAASVTTKMEAAKWFAKMADYEPKQNVAVGAGSGFQLVINFSSSPNEVVGAADSGTTYDAEVVPDLFASPPPHIALRPPHNAQFIAYDDNELHTA